MSEIIRQMLQPIPIPKVVRIKQRFDSQKLVDVLGKLHSELKKPGNIERILSNQRVAIAVGSRGIAHLASITRSIVDALKAVGAYPFIVPCMGSHGGATSE